MWFPSLSALWLSALGRSDSLAERSGRRPAVRSKPTSAQPTVETLEDRCVPASLSVSDAFAVEGGMMAFTVTLSEASATTVSVRYDTADGWAVSKPNGQNHDRDFDAQRGALTFAPGQTSKTILIQTIDDGLVETDWETGPKYFFCNLSQAKGATILDGTGLGEIGDNDSYYDPYYGYEPYSTYDPYAPYSDPSMPTGITRH